MKALNIVERIISYQASSIIIHFSSSTICNIRFGFQAHHTISAIHPPSKTADHDSNLHRTSSNTTLARNQRSSPPPIKPRGANLKLLKTMRGEIKLQAKFVKSKTKGSSKYRWRNPDWFCHSQPRGQRAPISRKRSTSCLTGCSRIATRLLFQTVMTLDLRPVQGFLFA